MTQALPRFARPDVRTIAGEFINNGWSYDDIDSNGHHVFTCPCGEHRHVLPETPGGMFWMRRARDIINRCAGTRRGSFDRDKQRKRAQRKRDMARAASNRQRAEYAAEVAKRDAERRAARNAIREIELFNADIANGTTIARFRFTASALDDAELLGCTTGDIIRCIRNAEPQSTYQAHVANGIALITPRPKLVTRIVRTRATAA